MLRVALYARYSSDLQSDASVEDQLRLCRARADSEGWQIVESYSDRAISGASMMRPGLQGLLSDAQEGRFDVVLAESLDRLSRDQEDIAHIYKRLTFRGVKVVTLSEGPVSEIHIGLKGTMGALYLKDLADKTRRGLSGRVMQGKSGGGNAYGYDVVKRVNADGAAIRGERTINPDEAEIVRRIFRDYAAGKSPKAIAMTLNKEGIAGPGGNEWGQSTINGNRHRGTGILNNELYIGRMIWNRQRFIKDPDTGKRVARPNPESEWIVSDVPELRIVDQELWDIVKARQGTLERAKPNFWKNQRPRNLFSYLLKCGECGGGFAKISQTHYGCSTARNKGTCDNRLAMGQVKLEAAIIEVLQSKLMDPALCDVFCQEYTRHVNQVRRSHNAALAGHKRELKKLERDKARMIDSIKEGVPAEVIRDELIRTVDRIGEIERLIADAQEAPVMLHPNMAQRYRNEVLNLIVALNDEAHRHEAADLLRSLIDKVVLTPNPTRSALTVDVHGDLAGILAMAHKEKGGAPSRGTPPVSQVKLVAGAGFEPATFRL
ncbi:recombinase family protein [Roseospirillum parvum]|uniref:Site-specific DNA recombinase n=1 Tax=Roseospirillum parvum TaxID=83401 RepID=A0A1G8F3S9_9PROT|nr:recombinase family protein [Roseospirillum parvum]SDH76793.1 Site-specific DNA recombinase [Roseospirillum parvum]